MITPEESARDIVENNEGTIIKNLIENKIMFEDQFDQILIRPVSGMISNVITEKYDLGEDVSVHCSEICVEGEWRTVYWRSDIGIPLSEIAKIAQTHYGLSY